MTKRVYITLFWLLAMASVSFAQSLQISASATSGCAPLAVTFSANQSSTSYLWNFSNGASSSSASPVIVFTSSGVYSVTLTLANGTSTSEQNFINVSAFPHPGLSLDTNVACKGNSIHFTASGEAGSTFYWDMGDGTVLSGASVVHSYSQSGNYSIAIQETSANGCVGANSFPSAISILNTPSASILKSVPFSCSTQDTIIFTSAASGMTTYAWKINGVTVPGNTQLLAHVFSSPGSYTIQLKVINSSGCEAIKEIVFNVYDPAVPSFNTGILQGCQPFHFSETVLGQGFNTIHWSSTAGHNNYGLAASMNFSSVGSYQIMFDAVDQNGCIIHDTITPISVLESPVASFVLNDSFFCDTAQVVATSQVFGAQNYWWTIGNTALSAQVTSLQIDEPGNYHVMHGVTLLNGCSDSTIAVDLIQVETGKPMNDIVSRQGCVPYSSVFEHNNVYLTQELWLAGNGDFAYGDQVMFSYPNVGSYDVTFIGTSQNGCTDTTIFEQAVTTFEGSINFNGPSIQTYCEESSVLFDGTILGNNQFLWDFGDGNTSTDSLVNHFYDTAGVFVVSLTSRNNDGCTFTIDTHSIIRVSDLTADFSHQILTCVGRTVTFNAIAQNVISYNWDIGGFASQAQDVTYTFPNNGPFDVSLEVYDSLGCDANITKANLLDFSDCAGTGGSGLGNSDPGGSGFPNGTAQDPLFEGCAPFNIYITNPFDSIISIVWYFGDGDTSHVINPSHEYDSAGLYDLSIVKTDLNNETDSLVIEYFAHVGQPIAQFSLEEFSMCTGSFVQIINTSSNSTNWSTSFGDGYSSVLEHANHTYDSAGYFTVALTAMDDLGCFNTDYSLISANFPNPDLNIDHVLCGNQSTTIDHNIDHFEQYEWHIGDSIMNLKFPTIVGFDTGTYSVWLNGLDSNGCGTILFAGTVVQISSPFASFTFPSGDIVCNEVSGLINNLSAGATTYKWYQDSSFFSVNTTPYIQIIDTGVYEFMVIAKKGNCSASFNDTLLVTEGFADFNYSVSSYCLPAVISFSDQSLNANSWQWTFGNNQNSSSQNPDVTFTSSDNDSIKLSIVDQNGCSASKTSGPIDFHRIQFNPSDLQGCAPMDIVVSDTASNSTFYNWTFSNGNTVSGNYATTTFNSGGYYSVTLTAGHTSGCSTTVSFDSIIHVAEPQAAFSLISNSASCAPLLAEFQNNSIDASSFTWQFGDGFVSQAQNPQHFYLSPDTFDVTLIAKGLYNCADSFTIPELIKVSGPLADFNLSPNTICLGDTIFFENTSKRSTEYTWLFGDGTTTTEFEPYHVYTEPGYFDIVLSVLDSGLCYDLKIQNNYHVKETPKPNPQILQHGNCIPVRVDVQDNSQYAVNPIMTWIIGNQTLSASTDTSLLIVESGEHAVSLRVKNSNGCEASIALKETVIAYDTLDESIALLKELSVGENHEVSVAYEINPHDNFISHELHLYNGEAGAWELVREGSEEAFNHKITNESSDSSATCFKLRKINHCVTTPLLEEVKPHCSINLSVEERNNIRYLNWTPIKNATFDAYSVQFKLKTEAQFHEIGSVSEKLNSFEDPAELCPDEGFYRIVAQNLSDLGSDAIGNKRRIVIDTLPILYEPANIDLATVLEDESVLIQWRPMQLPDHLLGSFELHKMSPGKPTIVYNLNPKQTEFIDYETDVQHEYASYHLEIHNVCEILPVKGTAGSTILLQKNQDGLEVELQWNPYDEWEKGVKEYQIQKLNEFGEWEIIKRVSPDQNSIKIDLTE